MNIHIIDDPFDRAITYNTNCRLHYDGIFSRSSPEYIVAKISIVNYRVIRAPLEDEDIKRGDLITRKDLFLLHI